MLIPKIRLMLQYKNTSSESSRECLNTQLSQPQSNRLQGIASEDHILRVHVNVVVNPKLLKCSHCGVGGCNALQDIIVVSWGHNMQGHNPGGHNLGREDHPVWCLPGA